MCRSNVHSSFRLNVLSNIWLDIYFFTSILRYPMRRTCQTISYLSYFKGHFKDLRVELFIQWEFKNFQGLKFMFTKFKYFQGLEMGLLKFKGFQDA